MRKLLIPFLVLAAAVALVACGGNSSQNAEYQTQTRIQAHFERVQPVPSYSFSQLRQNLREIETAQAEGVQTTSFFFNLGDRDPIQTCPSVGAPIPSTDQITNPQQPLRDNGPPLNNGDGNVTLSQMEPTGVYTGDSTGTYVICVGADGKPYADYWEGYVQTVFGPAEWNYSTHSVELVGPPSFSFTK